MEAFGAVYRDGTDGMRAELRELLDRRLRELDTVPASYRAVYARRCGRAAAGLVAAIGALIMFGAAVVAATQHGWFFGGRPEGDLTRLLAGSWLAAAIAYFAARAWAAMRFDGVLARRFALTGVLHTDLDMARHVSPRREAAGVAGEAEVWSAGLPLVGLAMLLPLTLHYVGAAVIDGGSWPRAGEFDEWIVMSTVLVGHSHVVLAVLSGLFARSLARDSADYTSVHAHKQGWAAWGWTTASSAVPGALLFGIPVFLVAITGVFIPVAFSCVTSQVLRERAALAG